MHIPFERDGDLMDLASYPRWLQDVVGTVSEARERVRRHEVFSLMRDGRLTRPQVSAFFVNGWPVVEQFPKYMSMNLLKANGAYSPGEEKARRYLIRNIRVELNHVAYWIDWAEASGVSRQALMDASDGMSPPAALALSHWCWKSSNADSLAASIAATNYAIEGVTGEWSSDLCQTKDYELGFEEDVRGRAMRWLKVHAGYDDKHPWEALDIVATLLGHSPSADVVRNITAGIERSFRYFEMSLSCCLDA
ncbi:TenA family transcriptional regulator [Burkholderia singularis]|uniref:Pyrroloquinoline quinone (Coenzyme PQQ) biosynthesis protein C n=1 Tax=Burkholderia singularis TaxID=1503053 RepID=A0A103E4K3_9BURK|nr:MULTISPECIES: iron-containing redox enzyme family protein [Burkholderia]AOK31158.1 TenA family transcriptional regulator [Burkholderia sp. Bp7605]KVE28256.1 TenA family transcriptional regulator [Burkholderia singularis]SMF99041.1 Pyrroloquinoline quinone (Coenzyme PQQ) biosynthesis protein C [Burkholderia singularis]